MKKLRLSIQQRLIALLEKEGFRVSYISGVEGYWRKEDVERWEGHGWRFMPELNKEVRVTFGCWNTMTECVKYGIYWEATELSWRFEIYANYKNKDERK